MSGLLSLEKIRREMPEIQWLNYRDVEVSGIGYDSRKAVPGCLFVALRGEKFNGEDFAREAVTRGAVAVVAESDLSLAGVPFGVVPCAREALAKLGAIWWDRPSRRLTMVGITGTNGKTTTSLLLADMLQGAGHRTGLIGTIGYRCGNEWLDTSHTTPEPLTLQENLARMAGEGITHVVMEVSSHSLDQNRVSQIDFRAAIFTNLGRDHLDYHKTREEYLQAKSLLFRSLPTDSWAILNADDSAVQFLAQATTARKVFFSVLQSRASLERESSSPPPDAVFARNICFSGTDSSFELVSPQGTASVSAPLPGIYNIYNILASASCALAMGVSFPEICAAVKGIRVPGRMEVVDEGQPFVVLIDYAHTPDALSAVLTALRSGRQGKLILVFGCGGDRDKGKRPQMGAIACRYADHTWVTSDNPRSESPEEIAYQICEGFSRRNYTTSLDRREAIFAALQSAGPDDVVLIAGKGHETYQLIGQKKLPFSDREVTRGCLAELGFSKA